MYKKILVLAAITITLLNSSNALANPTRANLSFKYSSIGRLTVDVKFDKATSTNCIARHRSSLYFEGDTLAGGGVIRRSTHSRVLKKGRKSTSLRASRLPGVVQDSQGADPIMAVQVRIVCSGQADVDSNVVARFIRCGTNTRRVSLKTFLSTLQKKLVFSS